MKCKIIFNFYFKLHCKLHVKLNKAITKQRRSLNYESGFCLLFTAENSKLSLDLLNIFKIQNFWKYLVNELNYLPTIRKMEEFIKKLASYQYTFGIICNLECPYGDYILVRKISGKKAQILFNSLLIKDLLIFKTNIKNWRL